MKLLKLAFRLSVLANIVFVFWFLRERTLKNEEEKALQEGIHSLDRSLAMADDLGEGLRELNRSMNEQSLRNTASIDQVNAFLEERGIHVE